MPVSHPFRAVLGGRARELPIVVEDMQLPLGAELGTASSLATPSPRLLLGGSGETLPGRKVCAAGCHRQQICSGFPWCAGCMSETDIQEDYAGLERVRLHSPSNGFVVTVSKRLDVVGASSRVRARYTYARTCNRLFHYCSCQRR
jgi:hypothetical protein